jgi:transcriptional regulator with XRE-family HTH domain
MSRGYSLRLAKTILNADADNLGVQLGRICLEKDVSVIEAADALGVTRTTLYSWFCGKVAPHKDLGDAVNAYIDALKNR